MVHAPVVEFNPPALTSPSSLTSPARMLTSSAALPANRLSFQSCQGVFQAGDQSGDPEPPVLVGP